MKNELSRIQKEAVDRKPKGRVSERYKIICVRQLLDHFNQCTTLIQTGIFKEIAGLFLTCGLTDTTCAPDVSMEWYCARLAKSLEREWRRWKAEERKEEKHIVETYKKKWIEARKVEGYVVTENADGSIIIKKKGRKKRKTGG